MCSRIKAEKDVVMRDFDIDAHKDDYSTAKWGELYPTDPILVVGYGRQAGVRRWGLKPDWAERPIINAKSEEAAVKRTFQPLLNQRCVVPTTGYFEWRVEEGRKIKTLITLDGVLPMAGFLTDEACVILTCAPSAPLAYIHHRMPAILDDDTIDDWLNPDADFKDVRMVLKPSLRPFRIEDAEPVRIAKPRPEPRQASLF